MQDTKQGLDRSQPEVLKAPLYLLSILTFFFIDITSYPKVMTALCGVDIALINSDGVISHVVISLQDQLRSLQKRYSD